MDRMNLARVRFGGLCQQLLDFPLVENGDHFLRYLGHLDVFYRITIDETFAIKPSEERSNCSCIGLDALGASFCCCGFV